MGIAAKHFQILILILTGQDFLLRSIRRDSGGKNKSG
jgi:hypothetical protein